MAAGLNVAVQVKMDSFVLESELHAVERPCPLKVEASRLSSFRFASVFSNKLSQDDKLLLLRCKRARNL